MLVTTVIPSIAAFDEMFAVGEASDGGDYASEVNHGCSRYFVVEHLFDWEERRSAFASRTLNSSFVMWVQTVWAIPPVLGDSSSTSK